MNRCRTRWRRSRRREAEATVAAALGKPLAELFASFGPAVAAASIAQVHKAEADGHTLAVKVLRPGIERRFRSDLDTMYFAARNAERHSAEARRLRLIEVVDTLARSVTIEMDLRLEAAAIAEIRDNTKDDPDFRVPAIDWERTARTVLTLEWIDGTPLSNRAALEARGLDLPALGRALMQTFLRHALRDGFFHADMHPGNLFVDSEGHIAAVDFGIMGRLSPRERRFLAEILYGFITGNYHRTAEVHFEAGYVPPHHSVESFAQAIRAIGEPIHNKNASEISMAKLLTMLFEVTGLFDMKTRPELLMLQKTMVVVEGVARSFDPNLDMWATAEPVVQGMDRTQSGACRPARGRRAGRGRGRKILRRRAGPARPRGADHRSARCRNARRAGARARNGRGDRPGRGARQPLDAHCAVGDRRAARGGDLEDGLEPDNRKSRQERDGLDLDALLDQIEKEMKQASKQGRHPDVIALIAMQSCARLPTWAP